MQSTDNKIHLMFRTDKHNCSNQFSYRFSGIFDLSSRSNGNRSVALRVKLICRNGFPLVLNTATHWTWSHIDIHKEWKICAFSWNLVVLQITSHFLQSHLTSAYLSPVPEPLLPWHNSYACNRAWKLARSYDTISLGESLVFSTTAGAASRIGVMLKRNISGRRIRTGRLEI